MKKQETEQKDNATQANETTMEQRTDIIRDMVAAQNRTAEAIDRMTAALKYLADVVGYGVDRKLSEAGIMAKDAHPGMTVSGPAESPLDPNTTKAPLPDPPPASQREGEKKAEPAKAEPTVEDVRAAMNAYAKREGKNKALALIDRYSPTRKVDDIAPDRYGELLMEAAA